MNTDTDISNSAQCRETDPITSRLSALKVNTASCDRDILNYLCEEGPANTYVISQMIERKETTCSSALSRLRREGKVHEAGMDESSETGHKRIIWAYGPSSSFRGAEHTIPARRQEPRPKWSRPFTEADIEKMGKTAGKYIDIFTTLLNAEIEARLHG